MRYWGFFCGSVRRLRCSCVQVQMLLAGPGLHIERISVNTTGCIRGAITWAHFNKLFHSYAHWNTEGGWILLYCNEVIYCNGEHLQSAVAWISLLFCFICVASLLTLCLFLSYWVYMVGRHTLLNENGIIADAVISYSLFANTEQDREFKLVIIYCGIVIFQILILADLITLWFN